MYLSEYIFLCGYIRGLESKKTNMKTICLGGGFINIRTNLIVFATIIIAVNNFVMYYAIQNNSIHSRIHSRGLIIFLLSLVEIVAFAIYGFIHFK